MRSFDDQEIWNEFQWENHLTEMEEKSEKLRSFIETNLGENTPRWSRFLSGYSSKLDAIDAYIEDELMFEDAYFPDDEDDWEEEDDDLDDFFLSVDDDDDDDESDAGDSSEAWKESLRQEMSAEESAEFIAEIFADEDDSDSDEPESMHMYDEAREVAADMLKLAELVPKEEQSESFILMVTETVNLGAKVAGAFAFGFDPDVLGGNIAYCKRALNIANRVLDQTRMLKDEPYMRFVNYESLHERVFELRNDLGVHIQEMRDQLREHLQ
jgi:hypothetical protein